MDPSRAPFGATCKGPHILVRVIILFPRATHSAGCLYPPGGARETRARSIGATSRVGRGSPPSTQRTTPTLESTTNQSALDFDVAPASAGAAADAIA